MSLRARALLIAAAFAAAPVLAHEPQTGPVRAPAQGGMDFTPPAPGSFPRTPRELSQAFEREVPSREVGESVMKKLHALDPVAYVRFASVYREFKDVEQFMRELKDLLAIKASK